MKRIICLLLVVLMVGALLVACGEQTDPGVTTPPTTDNGGNGGGDDNGGGGTTIPPTGGNDPEKNWYDGLDFTGKKITLQLSEVDDKELACGHKKYMQGPESLIDGDTGFENVQNEVLKRNDKAKKALGLEDINDTEKAVQYVYIAKDWGQGIAKAIIDAEALGPGYTPDMYSDQMYDMAGLSFQHGIFANIMKYTLEEAKGGIDGWKEGAGYFKITNSLGYNKNLMEDMALTPENKMFLIASDYYVDVMRAMVVMPFNLAMYAGNAVTDDPNAEKLYKLVEEDQWTWDQLFTYKNVYTGSGKASIDDERILMALCIGGLSGTALVYSTAFENYSYNKATASYTLDTSCSEIVNAFKEAAELAEDVSVACGDDTRGQPGGIETCKRVFTSGRALFAGPMMLGVVEETAFTQMEKLSIVPVPKNTVRSTHNTTINSRARVGAVSFNSLNKDVISAWIQYSTEQSDVVKKEYFDKAMNNKYLAGSGASVMLDLIYRNVGDNKSMIIDNMILHKSWEMQNWLWSHMIQASDFQGHKNDINSVYLSAVEAKQSVLNEILDEWKKADSVQA